MQIKEVIVVEGKNDTLKLKSIFGAELYTIETGGSAINSETIELIRKAHLTRGVIVFTDPDSPGKKIRSIIACAIPDVAHAFLEKEVSISKNKRKVGIEHASSTDIKNALSNVYTVTTENTIWNTTDMYELGLMGDANASLNREYLSRVLCLGHVNAKQMLKRLNLFGISKEEVITTLKQKD